MDWIYLASNKKASLSQTINTIINSQLIWRSANNKIGARIANVSSLSVGDRLVVAWREGRGRVTAYLLCTIGSPLSPVHPGLVIDDLGHADAKVLEAAGYDISREAEAIRLDSVDECYFQVAGGYKGNNALFRLAPADAAALVHAATIPPEARAEAQSVVQRAPAAKARTQVVASGVETASPAGTASVDGFAITGSGPRAFDAYVMVDWSSSSTKVTGKDSIWIAQGEWSNATFTASKPRNVSTRVQAISEIRSDLESMQRQGKRVLVGFDFAFGYPAGFAKALGLATTRGAWSALHSYFAANVKDAPNNAHNRDAFADECNRKIAGPGPFWGCTKGAASPTLTQHRVGVSSLRLFHRLRLTLSRDSTAAVSRCA